MTATAGIVDDANLQFNALREKQLNIGTLPSAWPKMQPFMRMMKKGQIKNTWKGRTTGRLGVFDKPATGGGASFGKSFANTSPPTAKQFNVPIREMWQQYLIKWVLLQVMEPGGMVGDDNVQGQLARVVEAFWTMMSILVVEDGTGRWAKGDGAWTITGDTITFVNRKNAHRFEEDDVLSFTPFNEAITPGSEATPRAYTGVATQNGPIVLGVDIDAGTVLTDQADLSAVITGLTNSDYIGKDSMFGSDNGILDGFFAWVPYTRTESLMPLFGVDRSVRPDRLAGKRIVVNAADSPAEIIANMLERTAELSNATNTQTGKICVPTTELTRLSLELQSLGFTIIQPTRTEYNPDPMTLTMGLNAVEVVMNDLRFKLLGDLYLSDKELPADEDRTYTLTLDSAFHIETTSDGLNWQNRGGRGILERVDGSSNDFAAPHGGAGNMYPDQVGDCMIASTRAAL